MDRPVPSRAQACNMALILTTFPLSEAERGRCCKKDSALTNKIGRIVKNRIYLQQNGLIYIYIYICHYFLVASKVSCPRKMGRWWRLTRLLAGWRRRKRPPKESQRQGIGPPRFQPIMIYFRKPNRLYVCGALQEDGTWWNMMEQAEWSAWECDWSENKICTMDFPTGPLVITGLFGCNAKYSSNCNPNSMLPPDLGPFPKQGPAETLAFVSPHWHWCVFARIAKGVLHPQISPLSQIPCKTAHW